ncbi:hypothetical protein ACIQ8D_34165 [Streptomyces sp. NPDC096094]|uniref:hypothetical protein n=1 Tax=Streptomyces sp. NPDC096094 TaxID=3366073 RepID=UPI003805A39C
MTQTARLPGTIGSATGHTAAETSVERERTEPAALQFSRTAPLRTSGGKYLASALRIALEHLHGHVPPRYGWEPPRLLQGPVWRYEEERTAPEHALGPRHDGLREDITQALTGVLADAYDHD